MSSEFCGNIKKRFSKPVDQFSLDGKFIKTWESVSDAVRDLNLKGSDIYRAIPNKQGRKQAGGFIWKYKI